MRVDTLIPLTSTAELWEFVEIQNPQSAEIVRNYTFTKTIKVMVTEATANVVVFCREAISFDSQLRNVKDAHGNIVLPASVDGTEIIGFVGTGMPVMDVFGNVMGWRYTLTRNPLVKA